MCGQIVINTREEAGPKVAFTVILPPILPDAHIKVPPSTSYRWTFSSQEHCLLLHGQTYQKVRKSRVPLPALFILVPFPWSHPGQIQLRATLLKMVLLLREHHSIHFSLWFSVRACKGIAWEPLATSKDECCPLHRAEELWFRQCTYIIPCKKDPVFKQKVFSSVK